MEKAIIRLCYRKLIDNQSIAPWEKMVFEDSYREFLMQAQYFNQDGSKRTLAGLLREAPGAERLHGLVSTAVVGYLRQLEGRMPDITDSLGRLFLPFENFRFEIVQSHIHDSARHQVAIDFYSDPMIWHDTIGDQLLLSVAAKRGQPETLTHLLALRPMLGIHSIQ